MLPLLLWGKIRLHEQNKAFQWASLFMSTSDALTSWDCGTNLKTDWKTDVEDLFKNPVIVLFIQLLQKWPDTLRSCDECGDNHMTSYANYEVNKKFI